MKELPINQIICGDALNIPLQDCSMDAIVTDPPYGLEFMGKEWDRLMRKDRQVAYPSCRSGHGPDEYMAGKEMQLWHTQWLTEAYRVLKPGGSMLVMGGTRTFHRLMCAIEDSGFIIKDTLMYVYGSGFPKAQDLGKMIDKRNGRDLNFYKPIADYIKQSREELGLSLGDVAKNFKSKNKKITGCAWNWENWIAPTWKDWIELKKILNLDDRFDEQIKRIEAKRKIIGKGYSGLTDCIFYGEMPKQYDITTPSTNLAKYWDGFKIGGIKPAYEPIVWAVKPPEGSYVDNVLKWGVGAVNVDECRIGMEVPPTGSGASHIYGWKDCEKEKSWGGSKGRFPANIILSHHPECVQVGMKRVKGSHGSKTFQKAYPGESTVKFIRGITNPETNQHVDKDGLETVESWQCHPDCPVKVMDEMSGELHSHKGIYQETSNTAIWHNAKNKKGRITSQGDSGGASRFFYCAKASRSERNAGLDDLMIEGQRKEGADKHGGQAGDLTCRGNANPVCKKCGGSKIAREKGICKCKKPEWEANNLPQRNNHPTVKPIALFEWLIKLVTREGQTVLDPFLGSGTTAISAHNTGRKCIGIEKEGEYTEIAKRRVAYWKSQGRQGVL